MPLYPLLTMLEQAELPRLVVVPTVQPNQFADSTHQVFVCDTDDGRMVLKVCNEASVSKSGFWQGFNHLFGAHFPDSLGHIKRTYNLLAEQGGYVVPEFVASSYRFVLTRYISGEDIDASQVTDAMVVQLANHIVKLHQAQQLTWGDVHKPVYQAGDWGKRLHTTLSALAAQSDMLIPKPLLQSVLVVAESVQETEFVPMMLDLRWDQFRRVGNAQSHDALALIDLDAFVVAPRALDLVLLEYVLTPQEFALLKATYKTKHNWPDYSVQKPCYQLLLFLMQVLGETDVAKWMQRI